MQYLYLFAPTLLGVIVCTSMVIFLANRMPRVLRNMFSMLVISILAWLLMYLSEMLIPTPQLKYFAVSMQVPFAVTIPVCVFMTVASFFGNVRLRWTHGALLLAVPALMTLLCWTNPLHNAFFTDVRYDLSPQMGALRLSCGWLFYAGAAYACALLLISFAWVVHAMIGTHKAYRRMCVLLLLAISIPTVCAALYMRLDMPGQNMTPLALALALFLLIWVVNDARLMEVFPLGRGRMIQRMNVPMICIDGNGYVADVNDAALKFFGRYDSQLLYRQANDVFRSCLNLDIDAWDQDNREVQIRRDDVEHVYLARQTRIMDGPALRARLVFFFDITEIKNREEGARSLTNYDALTGLPNRGFFAKLLRRDIDITLRSGGTLALLALEVHNLERIHSEHGFRVGETLMAVMGEILTKALRRIDTVAYIQTGQFHIILPQIQSNEGLRTIITRLMDTFAPGVSVGGQLISVTIHIGVSLMPQDAAGVEDLVSDADMALQLIARSDMPRFSFFSMEN